MPVPAPQCGHATRDVHASEGVICASGMGRGMAERDTAEERLEGCTPTLFPLPAPPAGGWPTANWTPYAPRMASGRRGRHRASDTVRAHLSAAQLVRAHLHGAAADHPLVAVEHAVDTLAECPSGRSDSRVAWRGCRRRAAGQASAMRTARASAHTDSAGTGIALGRPHSPDRARSVTHALVLRSVVSTKSAREG